MGLQRRLLLRATWVRMGQLVNRPGAPTLSSFVFLDTMGCHDLPGLADPYSDDARARLGASLFRRAVFR